jgi:hypothetical protein
VGDVAADRPPPSAQGEVRAALGAVLATLPEVVAQATVPGACDCAEQRAPV